MHASSVRSGVVQGRRCRHASVLLATIGCLVVSDSFALPAAIASDEATGALEALAKPDFPYEPPLDPMELLRVDAEMRAYFEPRVNRSGSVEERIRGILVALLEGGLGFEYEGDGNYSAAESFRRRRGNCMSFAFLFSAIAREYGLKPVFHHVEIEPKWTLRNRLVTQECHINVLVIDRGNRIQVDLNPLWERELVTGWETVLTDMRAFALFYSNLGVEKLVLEDNAVALEMLRHATRVDPTSGTAWVNLANGLLHTGDLDEAEQVIKRALALRPAELSAFSTMARLCRMTGRPDTAARFERKAQRYRDRNPYHHYALARGAADRGELATAARHLKRALSIKGNEPKFVELRIEVARQLGRENEAREWRKRLEMLGVAHSAQGRTR